MRRKLGPVKSTTRTGWNVNYNTEGGQITLTCQTAFANGEGTETFVYDTGSPPRLIGYTVARLSPDRTRPSPKTSRIAEILSLERSTRAVWPALDSLMTGKLPQA